jgi:hypothetical protein
MLQDRYELYVLHSIPKIPQPSPQAVKTFPDQMAETDPRVANLRSEQFIDRRFFQEMEKGGLHPAALEVIRSPHVCTHGD